MAELASGGGSLATNAAADDSAPLAARHTEQAAGSAGTAACTLTHRARVSPKEGDGGLYHSRENLPTEKESVFVNGEASTTTVTSHSVSHCDSVSSPKNTSSDTDSCQHSSADCSPTKTGAQATHRTVNVSSPTKTGTENCRQFVVTDSSTTQCGNQASQYYTVADSSNAKTESRSTHSAVNSSSPAKTGIQSDRRQAVTWSSGGSINSSLPASASRTIQNGQYPAISFRCSVLPVHPLLPKVGEFPEDVENASEASAASSGSTVTTLLLPLPPVPSDMAEAIKRQQKGTGSVRYWKTKHLQSGRNQTVSLKSNGGFQTAMFPALKHTPFNGSGVVGNASQGSGAESRLSKAKERLLRQKGRETMLGELKRTINNNNNNNGSNNNNSNTSSRQTPQYHTHYMYGHALGAYPPPPPAYRRSVTTLETLLALPLPASLLQQPTPSPPPPLPPPHNHHQPSPSPTLISDCPPNPKLTSSQPALTLTSPTLTLTQSPSQTLPQASLDPNKVAEDSVLTQQNDMGQMIHMDQPEKSTVTELTCLQLADAILGTKAADLSQYYQICQTKIRYVDFLERSATFRALESSSSKNAGLSPSPSLRHTHGPRHHTWVPSLDLRVDDVRPLDAITSDRKTSEGENGRESRSPVTLPSLGKMSRRIPPSTSTATTNTSTTTNTTTNINTTNTNTNTNMSTTTNNNTGRVYLPSPLQDTELTSPRVPAGFTGKPILKPFNPDNIPGKVPRHYDPFSPRSIYSDMTSTPYQAALRVRGATMYPLSTEEGRAENCREGSRRSQSSKSRKEAELRKRAVRFSISDQVYEFAPGEPVVP